MENQAHPAAPEATDPKPVDDLPAVLSRLAARQRAVQLPVADIAAALNRGDVAGAVRLVCDACERDLGVPLPPETQLAIERHFHRGIISVGVDLLGCAQRSLDIATAEREAASDASLAPELRREHAARAGRHLEAAMVASARISGLIPKCRSSARQGAGLRTYSLGRLRSRAKTPHPRRRATTGSSSSSSDPPGDPDQDDPAERLPRRRLGEQWSSGTRRLTGCLCVSSTWAECRAFGRLAEPRLGSFG
jgi:hypothetical protein